MIAAQRVNPPRASRELAHLSSAMHLAALGGADAVWTGTPPQGPGFWVPAPPANVYPPLEPHALRAYRAG